MVGWKIIAAIIVIIWSNMNTDGNTVNRNLKPSKNLFRKKKNIFGEILLGKTQGRHKVVANGCGASCEIAR